MATSKFNISALSTPEGVKELMASSTSRQEWNENVDAVIEAHDGHYPYFWFETVEASGFADRVFDKFKP